MGCCTWSDHGRPRPLRASATAGQATWLDRLQGLEMLFDRAGQDAGEA